MDALKRFLSLTNIFVLLSISTLMHAASDTAVSKLTTELTQETAEKANRLPMLSEMLEKLQGKGPKDPVNMLLKFKCKHPCFSCTAD